ncbi:hypothetical protein SORBI_3009G018450 [Sorghum bicolor]|uniref:Protein kinase domain-containing protein n=1 Tax=Sorghum bicolor TaxID=4558 RepID=A0A1Z5R166_SORBI|nr:hypothetical protein SORBI_3009G018450 [Sorghum bicolor]
MSLLNAITKNFSDGLQIGSGGFMVVYKVICLMKVRHQNIVRFLGYCVDTQGKMEDCKGKFILADMRLVDWSGISYKIIKGICEGLQYLHENNIVHLDLNLPNILLNDNMVPKIYDFGLSRWFKEIQGGTVTSTLVGSIQYITSGAKLLIHRFKQSIYTLQTYTLQTYTCSQQFHCQTNKSGAKLQISEQSQIQEKRGQRIEAGKGKGGEEQGRTYIPSSLALGAEEHERSREVEVRAGRRTHLAGHCRRGGVAGRWRSRWGGGL